MPKSDAYPWQFKPRFRRRAFGWKSQPAILRIKEAVSEIKQVARKDPALAGEGAVLFLERISPDLEQVDSSSGAIGTAVYRAMDALVPIIAAAPIDTKTRTVWLDRLWQAHMDDDIPYIERMEDVWGELCATPELTEIWADRLAGDLDLFWSADPKPSGILKGTMACFSTLLAAHRFDRVLALVDKAPFLWWPWRRWGVRALAGQGSTDEAIRYAQGSLGFNDSPADIAQECEAVLLRAGRNDEAYLDHAILATQAGTNLATFRSLAKKYPHVPRARLLEDLVASTPGDEGKWFATDGYDVTSLDVWAAYRETMAAAAILGESVAVKARLQAMLAGVSSANFVAQVLGRELAL